MNRWKLPVFSRRKRKEVKHHPRFSIIFLTLLFLLAPGISAENMPEETIKKHLDYIRSLDSFDPADSETIYSNLNRIWKDFKKIQRSVLPVLDQELKKELLEENPAQYFLLDIAYHIAVTDLENNYETVFKALKRINPQANIIRYNFQQLFRLFRFFARRQEKRILPLIPAVFFKDTDQKIFIPQHSLTLSPVLASAFLYGPYGPEGESHFLEFLTKNKECKLEALELLHWIGSSKSIGTVKDIFETNTDLDTFARCASFLIQMGGKKGKDILSSVQIENYDDKSKRYFEEVQSSLLSVSFKQYVSKFAGSSGDATLTGEEVKKRLAVMFKNYGVDRKINPLAILNSDLPAEYLISELIKIRSRMFHRLSDEGLSDIKVTNALINALQYRQ
jgi:hypothetical protein